MSPLDKWTCWEIMQCDRADDCPVSRHPDKPCWEIAKELDDYRSVLNVCKDCIVYVSRQKKSVLTDEDKRTIAEAKGNCVLKAHCVRLAVNED